MNTLNTKDIVEKREKVFFKIIIPNYNNYIYLKKCLDSIINQTFLDFKIIVVDDLSTDDSFKIAKIYERRYPDKVVAIQLKEKGHEGGARNAGIDYPIDCEYYLFVDGDDYLIDCNVLYKLFNATNNKRNLVVIFGLTQLLYNGTYLDCIPPLFDWSKNDIAYKYSSACTKIVRCDIIERFLENCDHAADMYWSMKIFNNHPSMCVLEDVLYIYRRNRNSITKTSRYRRDTELFYQKLKELLTNLTEHNVIRAVNDRIKKHERGIFID